MNDIEKAKSHLQFHTDDWEKEELTALLDASPLCLARGANPEYTYTGSIVKHYIHRREVTGGGWGYSSDRAIAALLLSLIEGES